MNDYDEALERFHRHAPEWGGGFANHGPMAAEALEALGHPVLIPDFVWRYGPRLPLLKAGRVLGADEYAAALGRIECVSDWIATFEAELVQARDGAHSGARGGAPDRSLGRSLDTMPRNTPDDTGWPTLLRAWLPRLVPGMFAGAFHGLLRVAHAVRALERETSPVRERELAHGLGYWAARFMTLQGVVGVHVVRGLSPAQSLRSVPSVAPQARRSGLFFEQVGVLGAEFAQAVEQIDADTLSFHEFLSELTCEAARLYLENLDSRIAYIHLLTGPSALRLLEPHLDPATQRVALGAVLQGAMALHAVTQNAACREAVQDDARRLAENPDELRYVAANTGEEHVIKFCEAALRENARTPDPNYLLAAADATLRLGTQHNRVA